MKIKELMMDMNQTLPADWFDDEQECRDDMQEMINIVCGTMPPLLSKLDFGLYTLAGSGRFAYGVCDTTIPFVLPEHEIEKMRDAFVSAFALTWGLEASCLSEPLYFRVVRDFRERRNRRLTLQRHSQTESAFVYYLLKNCPWYKSFSFKILSNPFITFFL